MAHCEELRAALQSMREGVLMIDTEARIIFVNQSYLDFVKKTADEIMGRPLREVRPGARLPEVLVTGQPILHAPRMEENDDIYFVNMYPVFLNGAVAGGLSVVTFIRDAYDFRTELEAYEKRNKQVLRRVNKANSTRYTFDSIVAVGENVKAVKSLARRAAATDAAVLLASESGTGKELYAQAIHNASPRSREVFVAINCANFNANTLESELFGYVEGAFTGAKRGGKIGLFEAASGGTLFLDEVSEMDLGLQAKLLRVIQSKEIRRVGGTQDIPLDIRYIAATNRNLKQCVAEGTFRQDLYYRLRVIPIDIPPLRERRADIGPLCKYFAQRFNERYHTEYTFTDRELALLEGYSWPGNVRELENVIEYFTICRTGTQSADEPMLRSLLDADGGQSAAGSDAGGMASALENLEKHLIEDALMRSKNLRDAGKLLNISAPTLSRKIKQYHIDYPRSK